MKRNKLIYQAIPKKIELLGRNIVTKIESEELSNKGAFGEARLGSNEIGLSKKIKGRDVSPDELKVTYLHEMLHFILNFTGYEKAIAENQQIDLEQFIELLAASIYQYEKSAEYEK